MLRITSACEGQDIVLRLEGKICRQWTGELRKQIHTSLAEGARITLDFTKVTYLDEEAADMISKFPADRLDKRNCSLYVRTVFERTRRS